VKAEVRIADERVSRRHIKVYPRSGEWYVKDLSSLNGSYIDAVPIDERKIDSDTSVSLDKGGPIVRLSASTAEPTRLTVKSS
jgi:pSer/pThr/pTyr-binding forkhead associated (FHA) protein